MSSRFSWLALALALFAFASLAAAQQPPDPPELAPMRAAFRAQDFDRAAKLGEALVATKPGHARAWQWLARSYGQQALRAGLLGKASLASKCRKAYERSVELDPTNAEAQYELLEFYVMAPGFMGGGEDKARPQAARIAKLDPTFGHLAAGLVAMRIDKEPVVAERSLRAAAATGGPQQRRARLALANFLLAAERFDDVRTLWNDVLASDPGDSTALYMVGRTAAVTGTQLEPGLAALDRYIALEQHPEEIGVAAAHWRRGLVLEKLGRVEDAIAALTRAVALDGTFEAARKDLDRLR